MVDIRMEYLYRANTPKQAKVPRIVRTMMTGTTAVKLLNRSCTTTDTRHLEMKERVVVIVTTPKMNLEYTEYSK